MKTTIINLTVGFALLSVAFLTALTRADYLIIALITVLGLSCTIVAVINEYRLLKQQTQALLVMKLEGDAFNNKIALKLHRLRKFKR